MREGESAVMCQSAEADELATSIYSAENRLILYTSADWFNIAYGKKGSADRAENLADGSWSYKFQLIGWMSSSRW